MASPRGFDSAEADEVRNALLYHAATAATTSAPAAAAGDVLEQPLRAADLTAGFPRRPVPPTTHLRATLGGGGGGGGEGVPFTSYGGAGSAGGLDVAALMPSLR
jgi:hypothetical protein